MVLSPFPLNFKRFVFYKLTEVIMLLKIIVNLRSISFLNSFLFISENKFCLISYIVPPILQGVLHRQDKRGRAPSLPFILSMNLHLLYFLLKKKILSPSLLIVDHLHLVSQTGSKNILLKSLKGVAGIYLFFNKITADCYIGSTVNLLRRLRDHLYINSRTNRRLHYSLKKYGQINFYFIVLERVFDKTLLLKREQFYLDFCQPKYNFYPTAGTPLGSKHSEETIQKLSLRVRGSLNPTYGRPRPEETRNKIRESMLGKNKGKYRSLELRKSWSESKKGDKNPM